MYEAHKNRFIEKLLEIFAVWRDYTMLPYLTIRHAQTVGVNDLSCLEHAKQSTSLTEIVAHKNLPVSTWFQA